MDGKLQHIRHVATGIVRRLTAAVHGNGTVRRVTVGHGRLRFNIHMLRTLGFIFPFDDNITAPERRLHIPLADGIVGLGKQIAGVFVPHLGRPLCQCIFNPEHCGIFLILHFNGIQCRLNQLFGLRRH